MRSKRVVVFRIWLAMLLLLALGVRVYHLGTQSLWYDEAVTADVASQGIAELTRWTADDIQPPLYYYLVAGWTRLAGRTEWALRFPSVFFGVLTTVQLWAVAHRLFGRRETGRRAASVVALLSSMFPLYVYYAQEARMYTVLTFLGVLGGYALLRAGADLQRQKDAGMRPGGAGWWVVFVLASAAMLYTHYFGVFLLLAYGICWLAWCRSSACAAGVRSLAAFVLSALAIIVLYLPWLPAMLNRYRVDASYWQGELKLGEALRHIAINFAVAAPEMMLESTAVRLLPIFGAIVVMAAAALWWRRHHVGAVLSLLAVLVIPVVAVLMLASRTPKFNPRYLMLASPAYLLLLAGGISALSRGGAARPFMGLAAQRYGSEDRAPRAAHHLLRSAPAFILAGLLVGAYWFCLHNWFTDPAFSKAQWRDVAAFVRQQRTPDEALLLVSGHAYPAWGYYAADIPATRLPPTDILDVNAVLGFDLGPALTQALTGKRGVWVVAWQDEVVDPVGFVPYFLARGGMEQSIDRQFWHLGLRYWRLEPNVTFPAEPQPQHADGANFDHKVALLGWDDPVDAQITVYWQALNPLTRDYQVSLSLSDATGRELGRWDGRPAGYGYPTFRWQPGLALFGRYPLPVTTDAPPGDYFVTVTVYDAADPTGLDIRDVADNPAGKSVRLGPVKVR